MLYRSLGTANGSSRFAESLPDLLLTHDATHGVQWIDIDGDGRLDLALTNNDPDGGGHPVFRNLTTGQGRGFEVTVTDSRGLMTKAGSEVRVFEAGTRRLLSSAIVDSGSGYCSQNAAPVHLAVGAAWTGLVDVEVTAIGSAQRRQTSTVNIDPVNYRQRPLRIAVP
jgi:hypothetical protein